MTQTQNMRRKLENYEKGNRNIKSIKGNKKSVYYIYSSMYRKVTYLVRLFNNIRTFEPTKFKTTTTTINMEMSP